MSKQLNEKDLKFYDGEKYTGSGSRKVTKKMKAKLDNILNDPEIFEADKRKAVEIFNDALSDYYNSMDIY